MIKKSLRVIKQLYSGNKDVFGLDIGTSFVKAVQLGRDGDGYTVRAVERVAISGEAGNGRDKAENIIAAVKKCVQSAQIKTKYAVCGLCGPDVASRRFSFPSLSKDEISNAVMYEAEQVCPFDSGKFIVDYQVFGGLSVGQEKKGQKKKGQGKDGGGTYGVLAAATPNVVGRKNQIVRASSLSCVLMDVDGLALANCFHGSENPVDGETIAILDVGSSFSNLAIIDDKGRPFVRDIAHAGEKIINDIAVEHNLSVEQVRQIVCSSAQEQGIEQLPGALEKVSVKLISEITETLRYYAIQEGKVVDRIFVCGGFGCVKGFVELLNSQLPPHVLLWNPLKTMSYDLGTIGTEIIKEYGPSLALAAGLAMRTI